MPPGSQFLASLVNYELTGLPPAAPSGDSNSPSDQAAVAAPITPHSPASGGAYDLQRMHRLLGALGDPHKRYPVLHVAGSKGKGSVVALLSSILRAAGYRVGTYSSPHLLTPQERIQGPDDGGAPISEERWEQLAQQVRGAAIQAATSCAGTARSTAAPPDNSGGLAAPASSNSEVGASSTADMPTYFEATTAMALQHFADSGADVAVIETGMGGRGDATNVFAPEQLQAAVITTLGMEHVAALGGSIQTIAAAKAGIMKPGRPLVLAAQPSQEAAAVVLQYAGELGCPVVHAGDVVQVSAAVQRASPHLQGHTCVCKVLMLAWLALCGQDSVLCLGYNPCMAQPPCPTTAPQHMPEGPCLLPSLSGRFAHRAWATALCHHEECLLTVTCMCIPCALQVSPTAPVTVEPCVGASLAQQAISIAATLPTSTDVPPGAALQLPDVPCRLVGGHQHSNIQVAVAAALLLRQQGWEVPDAAIAAGLSSAWLPGRFQVRNPASTACAI